MIGIYCFTNKMNGKSYVGQSTDIQRRFFEHKTRKTENTYFHDAIEKYGFENFEFKVLEECRKEELDIKEKFYIKKLKAYYPDGYNVDIGGHGGHLKSGMSITDIDMIREMLKYTNMSNSEIGNIFGLSDQTISDINVGKRWYCENEQYPIRIMIKKEKKYCSKCGKELYKYASGSLCRTCLNQCKKSNPQIEKDELVNLLALNSFEYVGGMFGVTGNAVRKWCDKYGIPRNYKYYKVLGVTQTTGTSAAR